ncbi:MAG: nitrite/sulfite reductase [Terriglobia bacterium]|nr:nitrite/sulfite reductase [Terriglobia bacterium]
MTGPMTAPTANPTIVKETSAQRMERLKRQKNPWEAFDEVRAFARQGRSSVVPDWASAYFKWWGIYTQGDGVGVTGGKGGEGKMTDYFMMRIGVPNGILDSRQLRTIAELTRQHARNLADITVRQNIQLHWLTIESLPEIVDALDRVGLSPKGACGDVSRNVTGCPLAGIAADEIADASPLALGLAHMLTANPEFYNLPRKFKVSIAGCRHWCTYPEINEIGLTAIERKSGGGVEVGYSIRVGGGLSNQPHLGVRLNAFLRLDQVLPVVHAVTELFRDQEVLRESRERARLKYLFLREGWDGERFLAEVEARLGYRLDPAVEERMPEDIFRDHVGIHRQKQEGLSYVGASVLRGRLSGDQLMAVAELSERFGTGDVRLTVMQNFLLINIPNAKANELARELEAIELRVEGSNFWRGAIACTGTEFCKLAITETKGFTRWLVEEMEQRVPQFDQQLKLNVTGCPNGCGQHWIADIGIEGKKIKYEGKMVDAYYFCLGGAVGLHQRTARLVGYRCAAMEVPEAMERLLRQYLAGRDDGENLRSYFARHSDAELRDQLAGTVFESVARDISTGDVPYAAD